MNDENVRRPTSAENKSETSSYTLTNLKYFRFLRSDLETSSYTLDAIHSNYLLRGRNSSSGSRRKTAERVHPRNMTCTCFHMIDACLVSVSTIDRRRAGTGPDIKLQCFGLLVVVCICPHERLIRESVEHFRDEINLQRLHFFFGSMKTCFLNFVGCDVVYC